MSNSRFSSDLPFTLFNKDSNQYSWQNLSENNKKFFWHQFLLNVLLDIPRSLTSKEDILKAIRKLADEDDLENGMKLNQANLDESQLNYTPDNIIQWYTRASLFFRTLNRACRTLNTDAIISFHSIIKDLTFQLKQLHQKQRENKVLQFPLTVYRGQPKLGIGEIERIRANVDGLISMNTFLSTTKHCPTALSYISGVDDNTCVFFEITINNSENLSSSQIFADITQNSEIKDDDEVLFGMSSIFKVISVKKEDWCWFIKLKLTSCEENHDMQKFISETKAYLDQISGKPSPFFLFKQFFNTVSLTDATPFIELLKYSLVDMGQLFIVSMHQKEDQIKQLIDMEPILHASATKMSANVVHSNQTFIYLLIDLLNNIRCLNDNNTEKVSEVSPEKNDGISLLCFGGFLFLTGDCDKAIQYFQMLLKYDSISEELKTNIQALLAATYAVIKEKELAAEYLNNALQSRTTSPWFAASMVSSNSTLDTSNTCTNEILDQLKLLMNEEQSNSDVHEKLRLIYLGHICSQEEKMIYALNRWEEALEITSYIPSSMVTILNGAIHVQMAAAYFRLNNISKTLNAMKNVKQNLEKYYPSTHRLFGTINLMHGFYFLYNGESSEAIHCLKKALENPYFSNDQQFLSIVYALLILAYIQSNQFNLAQEKFHSGLTYMSGNSFTVMLPQLLEELPEMRMIVNYQDPNYARDYITKAVRVGPQYLSNILRNSMLPSQTIHEDNYTIDQFILMADYYRHQENHTKALIYYSKALEKTTEIDSKYLWNIYKKMRRMNENDQYGEYFALLYSKYDDENPKDFQIISTLQIIMYKLNLSQHEFELAFNCLIHGILMKMKYFYHQFNTDSKSILNIFHQEQFIQILLISTKLIQIYSVSLTTILRDFFSKYFHFNDLQVHLAKIIYHEEMDRIICNIESKPFSQFLHTSIELLRNSLSPSEKSTLSIKNEILEFLQKYNDPSAPFFDLMQIFQSILMNDTQNFICNLDQFRQNTITFEHYNKLKGKFFDFFDKVEKGWCKTFLEKIGKIVLT